jgi:hypothetical protein
MRILMVKTPPAPMMDGFNVRRFRARRTYEVDHLMGRYLIIAGYAIGVESDEPDSTESASSR